MCSKPYELGPSCMVVAAILLCEGIIFVEGNNENAFSRTLIVSSGTL